MNRSLIDSIVVAVTPGTVTATRVRPVAVLQCGAMRLRPLTEAECYARCYGGFRTDQVSILLPGATEADQERVAMARLRELSRQQADAKRLEAA